MYLLIRNILKVCSLLTISPVAEVSSFLWSDEVGLPIESSGIAYENNIL